MKAKNRKDIAKNVILINFKGKPRVVPVLFYYINFIILWITFRNIFKKDRNLK